MSRWPPTTFGTCQVAGLKQEARGRDRVGRWGRAEGEAGTPRPASPGQPVHLQPDRASREARPEQTGPPGGRLRAGIKSEPGFAAKETTLFATSLLQNSGF